MEGMDDAEHEDAAKEDDRCSTDVVVSIDESLHPLSSFAGWVPQHAELIRSITVTAGLKPPAGAVNGMPWQSHTKAAQQLVQELLLLPQLSITPPAGHHASSSCISGAGSSSRLQETAQPVQQYFCLPYLASFSSDFLQAPAMLAALPAHSLTQLDLHLKNNMPIHGPGVAAALARLINLQELLLGSSSLNNSFPGLCLQAIASLTKLTSLKLRGYWCRTYKPLQQLLASQLPLQQLHLQFIIPKVLPVLDMERLTQLTELTTSSCFPAGSKLPVQLQFLQLGPCSSATSFKAAILPLQHLQQLALQVCFTEPGLLLQLQQLPALKHVSLRYGDRPAHDQAAAGAVVPAVATSSAWPKLRQLRNLCITFGGSQTGSISEPQAASILQALAAATSVTQLQLEGWVCKSASAADANVKICASPRAAQQAECAAAAPMLPYIAGLTQLRDLSVSRCQLWPAEALELTKLTGLTRLVLKGSYDGVGDLAATALACRMKQLRHLNLQHCQLEASGSSAGLVCLAAIRQLKQLTELRLEGNGIVAKARLELLTVLSDLQELYYDEQLPQRSRLEEANRNWVFGAQRRQF